MTSVPPEMGSSPLSTGGEPATREQCTPDIYRIERYPRGLASGSGCCDIPGALDGGQRRLGARATCPRVGAWRRTGGSIFGRGCGDPGAGAHGMGDGANRRSVVGRLRPAAKRGVWQEILARCAIRIRDAERLDGTDGRQSRVFIWRAGADWRRGGALRPALPSRLHSGCVLRRIRFSRIYAGDACVGNRILAGGGRAGSCVRRFAFRKQRRG